ncbi:hypothetical protein C922_00281 [Plasmodium inui San Antonio 1]|uniref:Uncharacterized protein n=1 Tax=Plasmodium inui San Antonio 1 TaxID=1237626 RepID=W7ADM5_9APIC|nr:hypothetical protein C922_00281 [Plasmodium inui San Antonio 1]EUD69418.1 hypothetical protein C922_00281 [Plasmodium inui San Antonio 1]
MEASGHEHITTTNNTTGMVCPRNTRLLLTHVQKHLKLVYVSGSSLGRDYTYILKNKGNIDSSCKESLFKDFQKRSLTPTGDILDRRWQAHIIQELINNEAIMCESSKGGLSVDLKPRNSFVHDIRNIRIVMITHNMDILQRFFQKLRYIKQRVLTTGISIIIGNHRELSLAVQVTLSMRNRTFSTEVNRHGKYLLNLKGEMPKIHTVLQGLKRRILVSIEILKIRNHQKAFGGIRTIILKKYQEVINSVCDPIRNVENEDRVDTYYKHSHIGCINRTICNRECFSYGSINICYIIIISSGSF